MGVKKYHTCKKDYSCNPSTCICKNSKYLKNIVCDEIINAADSRPTNATSTLSTNVANIILTNATSTVPINSDDKKVRYKIDC